VMAIVTIFQNRRLLAFLRLAKDQAVSCQNFYETHNG
jgi:hypothetical protein